MKVVKTIHNKISNKSFEYNSLPEIIDFYFDYIFKFFQNIMIIVLEIPHPNNHLLNDIVLSKERGMKLSTDTENTILNHDILSQLKSDKLKKENFFLTDLKKNFFEVSFFEKMSVSDNIKKILLLKLETKNKIKFYVEILFNESEYSVEFGLEKIKEVINTLSFAVEYHFSFIELKNNKKIFEEGLSNVLELLISLLEIKDPYTFGHSNNVKKISLLISDKLNLDETIKTNVAIAAILHDIGKVGVSDMILQKPSVLEKFEFEEVKKHSVKGAFLLAHIPKFKYVAKIIMHHHERFDGKGYPMSLSGEDIPIESRIISIADTYDAITSQRPYRSKLKKEDALEIIRSESGNQFDPKIVDVFLNVMTKIEKIA